jgi:tetratricopeptide (TPR) repeat protein
MATERAFRTVSPYASARSLRFSQLWQVPIFFVGLLAVIGVCAAIPLRHPPAVVRRERDIVTIRKALAKKGGAVEAVLSLAEKALADAAHEPARAGEAHFLLGSVYQRLADQRSPLQVATARKNALLHLEKAERYGVPEPDRQKLTYRLAHAWFAEGLHTRRVIDYLNRSVTHGADDLAQGYALLGQAYMRLQPPNLDAALCASLRVLGLPSDDDDILIPARLLCGEIYLKQKKPLEALKLLETVGSRAPHALLARARYLRGRCSQDLGMWDKAIPLLQEVLRDGTDLPAGRGHILYFLGLCYHNLDQPDEVAAVKFWEDALKVGGEAGQAAALCLAEVRLGAGAPGADLRNPAAALDAYRQALSSVHDSHGYDNGLVNLERARHQIAWGCAALREGNDFERSLQLAQLYKKLAPNGEAEVLEGEAAEAWALVLQEKPVPGAADEAGSRDEKARSQLFRAATAFRAAALQRPDNERAALLDRSSACFVRGRHFAEAEAALENLTALKLDDQKAGEAWFTLAETRMVLSQQDPTQQDRWQKRALEAYLKAIEYPGPSASRARYQLALAELRAKPLNEEDAARHLQQAQTLLEQNLDAALAGIAPDAQEKSLFELASLLFTRNKFDEARIQLVKAIDRYPANPGILQARDQLAECFRRLADEEIDYLAKTDAKGETQIHHRRKKEAYLEEAAKYHQKLADDLTDTARKSRLNDDDRALLLKARFAVAACRLDQENMTREALRLYKILANDYAHRLDGLLACEKIWTCIGRLGDLQEGTEGLRKAWDTLFKLPDSAFKGPAGTRTREQWEKWIRERAAYLRPAAGAKSPSGQSQ